ncbi:hypothetical protein [Falsibacillus pallidus]|uniref:hypothetical protein n=1 Tax=Falsibacillus pallidus TaxID=493781 RepID=UPI003D990765
MKLKALMAKIIPDMEKIQSDGEFHYSEIVFLEHPEQYPELVLGIENPHKTFVGQSHFRGKEKSVIFYGMVFKIIDLNEDENTGQFRIQYTPKKESKETVLAFDKKYEVFFDKPKPKWNRKDKKWEITNSLDRAAIGVVNTGVFYLNVYKGDSKTSVNQDFYKVCILPSSLSFAVYREMINEILNIQKELIMEEGTSKQSIQAAWKFALKDIEEVVNKIEGPLLHINKKPKVKLQESYVKVPIRNIRKYNSKTMLNLLFNQGNSKSLSTQLTESNDIYENRMIYFSLMHLKSYVETFRSYIRDKLLRKNREINEQMNQLLNRYRVDSITQLERLVRNFYYGNTRQTFYQNMIKNLHPYNNEDEETIEVEVQLSINNSLDYKMSFINGRLVSEYEGQVPPNPAFPLDYKFNGRNLYYSLVHRNNKPIMIKGRKGSLKLLTHDLNQHDFLYNCLNGIKQPTVIRIHAVVLKNTYHDNDPLRGGRIKIPATGEYYPNLYEYPLRIVKLKGINGVRISGHMESGEIIENLFSQHGTFPMREETLEQIKSTKLKKHNSLEQLKDLNSHEEIVDCILKRIDRFLHLPVFKVIPFNKEQWRLTQIFISDQHYSLIWKLLRGLDKKYEFTADFDDSDLVVKKTDQLYEYWILIVLLKQLTDTNWKIVGGETFKNLIQRFLQKQKPSLPANIEGVTIELEHEGKTSFMLDQINQIDLEGSVYIEKIVLKIYFNELIGGKRPDYAFEVNVKLVKNGKSTSLSKWFYLDAKYRNYDNQGGLPIWYSDLNQYAIEKYCNHYLQKGQPSHASFLVHPDMNTKYFYYGGYLNESMKKALKPIHDGNDDRNPRHTFGSFGCIPGQTIQLKTFIRMLLEYHFIQANTPFICFECGSNDTIIRQKPTRMDNTKYHITCRSCGDFWVRTHCDIHGHKLVKHLYANYHKEEYSTYPWYVKCPVCNLVDEYNDFQGGNPCI